MKMNICSLVLMSFILVGCASVGPTGGVLFHDIKYGIDATPGIEAKKRGEACQSSILGLVGTGDASIDTAKKFAQISEVSSVDATSMSILGLYNKYCTVVHGK